MFNVQDLSESEERDINDNEIDNNLSYTYEIIKKFKYNQDYLSKNAFFKSERDFKTFIQFWNTNMIPIVTSWWSSTKGVGIRWRVYDLVHIKDKCDEAKKLLSELTSTKPNLQFETSEIKISTLEELKLLEAISEDIEEIYFETPERNYIDITTLSKNKINEAYINMNMFFNEEIRKHLFNEYENFQPLTELFYRAAQSYAVEYSNEIQVCLKNRIKKKLIQIPMKNKSQNGKLSLNLNRIIKQGKFKLPNIKAKAMKNYFIKLRRKYEMELNSEVIDERIQILIDLMDFLVELLFPFAELYANRFINCYQFNGFSTFNGMKKDSFQMIIESM